MIKSIFFMTFHMFFLFPSFVFADVHPNNDIHHLGEPECVSLSGVAVHAQGLQGSPPS